MTAYATSLAEFAALCNVPVRDAEFFVQHVAAKMRDGMTLEEAIEHGRRMMVDFLANVQRYPEAARAFGASFYDDYRARAAEVAA